MDRQQQVRAWLEAQLLEHPRVAPRDRRHREAHVRHDVADERDLPGRRFAAQILDGGRRRAEAEGADMVGQHAVSLLRHRPVARPHPRLDVRERLPDVPAGERARKRRVRVAIDDRDLRAGLGQDRLEVVHDPGDLLGIGPRADPELDVGPR
jgi:hypothetical protein